MGKYNYFLEEMRPNRKFSAGRARNFMWNVEIITTACFFFARNVLCEQYAM